MQTEKIYFTDLDKVSAKEVDYFLRENYSNLGKAFHDFRRVGKERVTSNIIQFQNELGDKFILKQEYFFDVGKDTNLLALYETVNDLSNLLVAKGVPLPKTIETNRNKFFICGTKRINMVQQFVYGEHFSAKNEQIANLGVALADFHLKGQKVLEENPFLKQKLLSNILVEKPFETSVEIYYATLKSDLANNKYHFGSESINCGKTKVCDYLRDNLKEIDKLIAETVAFFNKEENKHLAESILHYDFNPNNCLFDAKGKLTAFLDLGYVNGPLFGFCVLDVADSMVKFTDNFISNRPGEDYKIFIRKFLDGYNDVRTLSVPESKAIIPSMTKMQLFRTLRILRRHYYENGRMDEAMPKLEARLVPGMLKYEEMYKFLLK